MEFFINEASLEGQYLDQEQFVEAIKVLRDILEIIKDLKSYSIYKDSQILMYCEAIKDQNFQQSLNNIRDKSLKTAFINILYNKINPQEWRDNRLHSPEDNFDHLKPDNTCRDVKDTSLAEITERKLQNPQQIYLVINFIESSFSYNLIKIIKNNDESHPVELDCVEKAIDLKIKLPPNQVKYDDRSLEPPLDEQTILSDRIRFRRIHQKFHGREIYRESATGRYWYVDNLHYGLSAHLEVFDDRSKHLGEADLDGNIDLSKQDKTKFL
jgi:hypothetical protein